MGSFKHDFKDGHIPLDGFTIQFLNSVCYFRLALASRAAVSLKKVARLVVESDNRQRRFIRDF